MNLMDPIINGFFTLNATPVCLFKVKITNFKNIQVRPSNMVTIGYSKFLKTYKIIKNAVNVS